MGRRLDITEEELAQLLTHITEQRSKIATLRLQRNITAMLSVVFISLWLVTLVVTWR